MTANGRHVVVVTGSLYRESDQIAAALADIADVVIREVDTRAALVELLRPAQALLTDFTAVDAGLLGELPKLRAIVVMGVGTDKIDVTAAKQRGVAVSNSPEAFATPVAEHAIALLLAAMRQVALAHEEIRTQRVWDTYGASYRPVAIYGKTLGLVGFGRIGREAARIGAGIGLRLVVYDPVVAPDAPITAAFPHIRFCAALDDLLPIADAVSLHLPLTPQTRGLMSRERLARMKPGAYLVNVSRGGLLDQPALRDALAAGHLAGAAVDVFTPEPPNWDDPLLRERTLVVTPHIAYLSETAPLQCQLDAAAEVRRLLSGQTPKYRVA